MSAWLQQVEAAESRVAGIHSDGKRKFEALAEEASAWLQATQQEILRKVRGGETAAALPPARKKAKLLHEETAQRPVRRPLAELNRQATGPKETATATRKLVKAKASPFAEREAAVEPKLIPADLKVRELRAELKQRGLPTGGRKAELIARLEEALSENDAASSSSEESEGEGDADADGASSDEAPGAEETQEAIPKPTPEPRASSVASPASEPALESASEPTARPGNDDVPPSGLGSPEEVGDASGTETSSAMEPESPLVRTVTLLAAAVQSSPPSPTPSPTPAPAPASASALVASSLASSAPKRSTSNNNDEVQILDAPPRKKVACSTPPEPKAAATLGDASPPQLCGSPLAKVPSSARVMPLAPRFPSPAAAAPLPEVSTPATSDASVKPKPAPAVAPPSKPSNLVVGGKSLAATVLAKKEAAQAEKAEKAAGGKRKAGPVSALVRAEAARRAQEARDEERRKRKERMQRLRENREALKGGRAPVEPTSSAPSSASSTTKSTLSTRTAKAPREEASGGRKTPSASAAAPEAKGAGEASKVKSSAQASQAKDPVKTLPGPFASLLREPKAPSPAASSPVKRAATDPVSSSESVGRLPEQHRHSAHGNSPTAPSSKPAAPTSDDEMERVLQERRAALAEKKKTAMENQAKLEEIRRRQEEQEQERRQERLQRSAQLGVAVYKDATAARKPAAAAAWSAPETQEPLEPSYSISDRECSSDEDTDEEEARRRHKKIPSWARSSNLKPLLATQLSGDTALDADRIFPPAETCDLTVIFNTEKPRYTRRTSSANWAMDEDEGLVRADHVKTLPLDGL